jgi:hypothetical protein
VFSSVRHRRSMRIWVAFHSLTIALAITLVAVLFQARATVGFARGTRCVCLVSSAKSAPSSHFASSFRVPAVQHRRWVATGDNVGEPNEDDTLTWERMYYESEKLYVNDPTYLECTSCNLRSATNRHKQILHRPLD